MPYSRADLIAAFRAENPDAAHIDDNRIFAAIAVEDPELAKGISELHQPEYKSPINPPTTGIEAGARRGVQNINPLNLIEDPFPIKTPAQATASKTAIEAGLEDVSKHPFATAASTIPIVGPALSNFMRRAPTDPTGALAEAGTTAALLAAIGNTPADLPGDLRQFSNTMEAYRARNPVTLSSVKPFSAPGTLAKPFINAGAAVAQGTASTLADVTGALTRGYIPKNLKKGPWISERLDVPVRSPATIEPTQGMRDIAAARAAESVPQLETKTPATKTNEIEPTPEVAALARNTEAVNQPTDLLKPASEPTAEIESTPELAKLAEEQAKISTTPPEVQAGVKRAAPSNRSGLPREIKGSNLPPATELAPREATPEPEAAVTPEPQKTPAEKLQSSEGVAPMRGFNSGVKNTIQSAFLSEDGQLLSAPREHSEHLADAGLLTHDQGYNYGKFDPLQQHFKTALKDAKLGRVNYVSTPDMGETVYIDLSHNPSEAQLSAIEKLQDAHPNARVVSSVSDGAGKAIGKEGTLNDFYQSLEKVFGKNNVNYPAAPTPDIKNMTLAEVSEALKSAIEEATEPVKPKKNPFETFLGDTKRNTNKSLKYFNEALKREAKKRGLDLE